MFYQDKILHIKSKSLFRIQALESALIETKLKYRKELDSFQMKLCDAESKFNQYVMSSDEIEEVLSNPPRISTMQDSMRRINQLEKCLRSQQRLINEVKLHSEKQAVEIKGLQDHIEKL